MTQAKIFEVTWEELSAHADEFRGYPKITLIVSLQEQRAGNSHQAAPSPEQRIRAMDAFAEKNRGLPVLPEQAFDRGSIYDDRA